MAKKVQQLNLRGKVIERDLSTARLSGDGSENLDPVPLAVTLGIKPTPTLDDRVRAIMRQDFFRKNPDYGLSSQDGDDYGPEENDPIYEFERRHERLEKIRREQDEAEKEYKEALAEKKKYLREQKQLKRAGRIEQSEVSDALPRGEISSNPESDNGDGTSIDARAKKGGPKD